MDQGYAVEGWGAVTCNSKHASCACSMLTQAACSWAAHLVCHNDHALGGGRLHGGVDAEQELVGRVAVQNYRKSNKGPPGLPQVQPACVSTPSRPAAVPCVFRLEDWDVVSRTGIYMTIHRERCNAGLKTNSGRQECSLWGP